MSFIECMRKNPNILMEGALGERLKREYGLEFDVTVAMANVYCNNSNQKGKFRTSKYI